MWWIVRAVTWHTVKAVALWAGGVFLGAFLVGGWLVWQLTKHWETGE